MTQENSRMFSSLWMLDRAERLFEKAETLANPAEASSLRRMGTNFLAGAEANGATVNDIRARYRIAGPVDRAGDIIFLRPRQAGVGLKG
jgi:hypothetical protein